MFQVVLLPKGEDFNDWLAVHVVDFFNRINLIYGTVCEQCTDTTCPTMSGGPKYEYLWQDGVQYKKPTHLPANQVFIFNYSYSSAYDRKIPGGGGYHCDFNIFVMSYIIVH